MSEGDHRVCGICTGSINEELDVVTCAVCKGVYHMGCLQRSAELCDVWDCWLCVHCTRNLFPFAEADDEYICKEPLKKIDPDQCGSVDANCELVVFPEESDN